MKIKGFLLGLSFFFVSLSSHARIVNEGIMMRVGLGSGYQWLQTSSSTEISKNGPVVYGLLSVEKYTESGIFGLNLGYLLASVRGATSNISQGTTVINPLLDVFWSGQVFPNYEVGLLVRNFFGPAAFLDIAGNTFEWMLSIGPQFRYHFKATEKLKLTVTTGVVFSLTMSQKSLFQVPLQIQLDLPGFKVQKEVEDERL